MAAERWKKWTTSREQRRTRASYPTSAIATEAPAKQSLVILTHPPKQFLPTQMTPLTHLDNHPHPLRWPTWPTDHLTHSDDPLTHSDYPFIRLEDPSDPARWPLWPPQMTRLTHSDDPPTHSDEPQGPVV